MQLIVRKRAEISARRMPFSDLFEAVLVGVNLSRSFCDFSIYKSTEVLVYLVVVELLVGQLCRLLSEIMSTLAIREANSAGLNTQIESWWIWSSRRVLNRRQGRQWRFVLIPSHKSLCCTCSMLRKGLKFLRQWAFARTSNIGNPLFALSLQFLHHMIVPHFPISTFDYLHLFPSIQRVLELCQKFSIFRLGHHLMLLITSFFLGLEFSDEVFGLLALVSGLVNSLGLIWANWFGGSLHAVISHVKLGALREISALLYSDLLLNRNIASSGPMTAQNRNGSLLIKEFGQWCLFIDERSYLTRNLHL